MTKVLYELHDVGQRYGNHQALQPLSLRIFEGEALALLGPNGCGKSTLLRLLAFLEAPTQGQLHYYGDQRTPRQEVTLLLQEPYLLRLSVFDNVTLGLRFRNAAIAQDAYDSAMSAVGFHYPMALAARSFQALSGGEKQRVALAARLIMKPKVLLLDEPTSNVDAASARALVYAIQQAQGSGTTVICSTHDEALVHCLQARTISLGQYWNDVSLSS